MIRKAGESPFASLMGGRVIREAALSPRRASPLAGDAGLGTGLVITLDGLGDVARGRPPRHSTSSVLGGFRGPNAIRPVRR